MKISDHVRPVFDPFLRTRTNTPLFVLFKPKDYEKIETCLSKHVSTTEIHDLIMGIFSGKYRLVERK